MNLKVVAAGLAVLVAGLVGLGVWGWNQSLASQARLAAELRQKKLQGFCDEAVGITPEVERVLRQLDDASSSAATSTTTTTPPPTPPPATAYPYGPDPTGGPGATPYTLVGPDQGLGFSYPYPERMIRSAPLAVRDDARLVGNLVATSPAGPLAPDQLALLHQSADRFVAYVQRYCR